METSVRSRIRFRHARTALIAVAVMLAATLLNPSRVDAQQSFEEIEGTLDDGTSFMIRKPQNWNGIVISDLDFRSRRNTGVYQELLERGYGLSGTSRRSDRSWTVSSRDDARRVQETLAIFRAEFGEPDTVISYGRSAGGTVALTSAEVYPETTDGAVAMCATIPVLTYNQIFDFFFVLKQLLGPADDTLVTHHLPVDNQHIQDRWIEVIEETGTTPEGRARIALAFALSQYPAFGHTARGPGVPMPDFSDPNEVADAMIASAIQIADVRLNLLRVIQPADVPPSVPPELVAFLERGRLAWNDGANYLEYWATADPTYREVAANLYDQAGLELESELHLINGGSRVEMDKEAVGGHAADHAWWVRGLPQVPLFTVENVGDQTAIHYNMHAYRELIERNGLNHLYRSATTDGGGHCLFTAEEELAAIDVMVERLNTAAWPATDPAAMNDRAGSDAFLDYSYSRANNMWRFRAFPDVFNAGPPTAYRKDDCKNGGWRFLGDTDGREFPNQGQCVSFVASNRP